MRSLTLWSYFYLLLFFFFHTGGGRCSEVGYTGILSVFLEIKILFALYRKCNRPREETGASLVFLFKILN